jgi:hypothetical protein
LKVQWFKVLCATKLLLLLLPPEFKADLAASLSNVQLCQTW